MREMQDGDKVQMIYDMEVDRRKGRNADRHVSMGEGERFGVRNLHHWLQPIRGLV